MLRLFTRIKDPVEGTAQVVSSTYPPDGATSSNVKLTLVVQAEGMAPFSTEHHCMCKVSRWPFPGDVLPVVVERDEPTKLKVRWDEVASGSDKAQAQADAIVSALGGQAPVDMSSWTMPQGDPPQGDPPQGDPPEEMLERLERLSALHDRGALTDAEFAAQKARLLDG